jgi:hypothetical protein
MTSNSVARMQLPYSPFFAGTRAALAGNPQSVLFKYKITHANDGTVPTLNKIRRRFLSRALPAILRKRRPGEETFLLFS